MHRNRKKEQQQKQKSVAAKRFSFNWRHNIRRQSDLSLGTITREKKRTRLIQVVSKIRHERLFCTICTVTSRLIQIASH